MHTLYFSPGACSLAPHIVLNELSLPHRLRRVETGREEHLRPEYLAVHPLGKVPTLVREDGERLTEVVAILAYLAELAPERELLPREPWARSRALSWLAIIASQMHPPFALAIRPDRVLPGASPHTLEEARERGKQRFASLLEHAQTRLVGPFALGERFSVVDPYLFVMGLWAQYANVPLDSLPRLGEFLQKVASRPAVGRALHAEGMVDAQGNPTPPTRV